MSPESVQFVEKYKALLAANRNLGEDFSRDFLNVVKKERGSAVQAYQRSFCQDGGCQILIEKIIPK